MPKKPLHDKLVHHSVHMLDLYQKQLKLTKEMLHAYECRISTMEEFIRANVTGDEKAFKILAPMVGKGTGTKRPLYDTGFSDGIKTKKAVQQAREWSAANEPEEGTSAVSSLQEGSATDQAREVPTTQGIAGFVLPPVESEGGAID
jgi:hypothetical protein